MSRKKKTVATMNETLARATICFTTFVFIVVLMLDGNCESKKFSLVMKLGES